ncbi:MAG: ABC transporter substrate-binding protein [Alphaproteobacteria bacterium]|nr:ABC transporter substrate-binding protein [Alphaproteobacteria bacterium]
MFRTTTILAFAAAATLSAYSSAATARDFTVVGWGGANQEQRSELFYRPFAKKQHIVLLEDVYLGGWGQFQAMQDTGAILWDVVQVESSELARGCEEGVFVKIDWPRIANRDNLMAEAITQCGLGMIVWSAGLAYNTKLVDEAPAGLEDFWNLEKFPGKRGMRQGPKMNLEFALMADGVAPDKVFEVLSTPEGVDRAFNKLDEIKPQLQFWKSGGQPPEWLAAGDVPISMAYSGRIARAIDEGKDVAFVWDRPVYAMDSYVILNGTGNEDTSYDFLNYIIDADPNKWAEVVRFSNYAVALSDVNGMMDTNTEKKLPAGENIANGLFWGTDEAISFWLDNQEQLTERWDAWAAQ